MNARLLTALVALGGVSLFAQAPASAQATQTHASDLGFTYTIPADWQVVDTKPSLPVVQQQVTKSATSEDEKKGISCVQIALTARHGDPASVVVVVALPYDCFGQTMTDKDLPGFASGASEGLKNTFDISNPEYGSYSVGTHSFWIERATGTLKTHPDVKYTVETACSVLKKGAVCWMAMAADDSGLHTFEQGTVALEGEAAAPLVPADAFAKKTALLHGSGESRATLFPASLRGDVKTADRVWAARVEHSIEDGHADSRFGLLAREAPRSQAGTDDGLVSAHRGFN
jgi:hypothetical protein